MCNGSSLQAYIWMETILEMRVRNAFSVHFISWSPSMLVEMVLVQLGMRHCPCFNEQTSPPNATFAWQSFGSLRINENLWDTCLDENEIGEPDAARLEHILQANHNIKNLSISGNDISKETESNTEKFWTDEESLSKMRSLLMRVFPLFCWDCWGRGIVHVFLSYIFVKLSQSTDQLRPLEKNGFVMTRGTEFSVDLGRIGFGCDEALYDERWGAYLYDTHNLLQGLW